MKLSNHITKIADKVSDGTMNPLEAFVEIHQATETLKAARTSVFAAAEEEAAKYGKGQFGAFGVLITLKGGAGRWDFKEISEVTQAEGGLKELKEKYKMAYKANEKGLGSVNKDGGEELKLPLYLQGNNQIAIQYPKNY